MISNAIPLNNNNNNTREDMQINHHINGSINNHKTPSISLNKITYIEEDKSPFNSYKSLLSGKKSSNKTNHENHNIKYSYRFESKDIAIAEAEAVNGDDDDGDCNHAILVKTCDIKMCSANVIAKGLCERHYRKELRLKNHVINATIDGTEDKVNNSSNINTSIPTTGDGYKFITIDTNLSVNNKKKICGITGCRLTAKRMMLCEKHYRTRNKEKSHCAFIDEFTFKKCRLICNDESGYCRRHYIIVYNLACTFPACESKEIYNFTHCLCRSHYYLINKNTHILIETKLPP